MAVGLGLGLGVLASLLPPMLLGPPEPWPGESQAPGIGTAGSAEALFGSELFMLVLGT